MNTLIYKSFCYSLTEHPAKFPVPAAQLLTSSGIFNSVSPILASELYLNEAGFKLGLRAPTFVWARQLLIAKCDGDFIEKELLPKLIHPGTVNISLCRLTEDFVSRVLYPIASIESLHVSTNEPAAPAAAGPGSTSATRRPSSHIDLALRNLLDLIEHPTQESIRRDGAFAVRHMIEGGDLRSAAEHIPLIESKLMDLLHKPCDSLRTWNAALDGLAAIAENIPLDKEVAARWLGVIARIYHDSNRFDRAFWNGTWVICGLLGGNQPKVVIEEVVDDNSGAVHESLEFFTTHCAHDLEKAFTNQACINVIDNMSKLLNAIVETPHLSHAKREQFFKDLIVEHHFMESIKLILNFAYTAEGQALFSKHKKDNCGRSLFEDAQTARASVWTLLFALQDATKFGGSQVVPDLCKDEELMERAKSLAQETLGGITKITLSIDPLRGFALRQQLSPNFKQMDLAVYDVAGSSDHSGAVLVHRSKLFPCNTLIDSSDDEDENDPLAQLLYAKLRSWVCEVPVDKPVVKLRFVLISVEVDGEDGSDEREEIIGQAIWNLSAVQKDQRDESNPRCAASLLQLVKEGDEEAAQAGAIALLRSEES